MFLFRNDLNIVDASSVSAWLFQARIVLEILNVVRVSETVPSCFLYSWRHKIHKIVWS